MNLHAIRRAWNPRWAPFPPHGRGRRASIIWLLVLVSCREEQAAVPDTATVLPHPARAIRVLILPDAARFEFAVAGPFHVRDVSGKDLSLTLPPLARTPVLFRKGSPTRMLVGGETFSGQVVDLVPEEDGTLHLAMRAGPDKQVMRRLPGILRCVLKPDGTADVINVVDVEDYLRGVLRGEVPPNWHEESYKAHAVAARTYVLYEKNTAGRRRSWDVTATARSQMYIGIDPDTEKTMAARAVDATRGIVCTWRYPEGDRIFCAYYGAVCGGSTQDASLVNNDPPIPPLAGRVKCDHCWRAPKGTFRWKPVTFAKKHIGRALRDRYEAFRKLGRVKNIEISARTPDGRARTIRVTDKSGVSASLSGEAFRLTIDPTGMTLKSTHFRIRDDGSAVTFTHGRGWGHGLGMCQWGAEGMARAGKTAEQILAFYYPGSRLAKVYD